MNNGAHVGVCEGLGIRLVVDHHVRARYRVAVVRSATRVLIHYMDEVTLAKVAQETFRIAPARGNVAAGTVGVHVDSNMLHRLHSFPAMELKVGGKPPPSRIWRGGLLCRSYRRIGDRGQ